MAQQSEVYQDNGVVRRTMIFDEDLPNDFTIKTSVDYSGLAETNAALAEEHQPFQTNKILARVPVTVYEQSVREGWDDADWKRFLNDPDNKMFRVWPGKV